MRELTGYALYHYPSCPYCALVRDALERLGLRVELRDIHADPRHRRDLLEATGRTTVPCLRIASDDGEDEWLHESRDIVRRLEARFAA